VIQVFHLAQAHAALPEQIDRRPVKQGLTAQVSALCGGHAALDFLAQLSDLLIGQVQGRLSGGLRLGNQPVAVRCSDGVQDVLEWVLSDH